MERYLLHADDDSDDKYHFKQIVADLDPEIKVIGFENGLALVQYLTSHAQQSLPDLIVLDVYMPMWDGIRTLKTLKAAPAYMGIPIIFWSTAVPQRDMDLSVDLGAVQFLTKPTTETEWNAFRESISRLLVR